MAANVDLSFRSQETWTMDATMHDSCGVILPINGGATVAWKIADGSGNVLGTLTIGSGIVLVDSGNEGECIITVPQSLQTSLKLVVGFYRHECQVVLNGGLVTDQFAGTLEVLPSLFA